MGFEVKVELLNPTTDEVVDSVTAQGVLPDVHKYISTLGFPHSDRGGLSHLQCFHNVDFIFQGIMCNSDTLDMSKSKNTFDPALDVIARGTNCTEAYTTTSVASGEATPLGAIDKRYGYYKPAASIANTNKVIKKWEWGTENGNGEINSIGLGMIPTALTYSKSLPTDIISTATKAINPIVGCPLYYTELPAGRPVVDENKNYATSTESLNSLIDVELSGTDGRYIAFYQTDKSIVFLTFITKDLTLDDMTFSSEFNVLQEDGTYLTKVRYKKIDKKWIYRYNTIMGCTADYDTYDIRYLHPLAALESRNIVMHPDGILDINTGTETLILPSSGSSWGFYSVEDNAYVVFGSKYGKQGTDVPPDYAESGYNIQTSSWTKIRFYAISGENPAVEVLDTVTSSSTSTNLNAQSNSLVFTKDKCIVDRLYSNTSSRKYNFVEKRTLSGNNLVWRLDLGLVPPEGLTLASDRYYRFLFEGAGKKYCAMKLYNTLWSSFNIYTLFDLGTGAISGYLLGALRFYGHTMFLAYDKEDPFRLAYTQNTAHYDMKVCLYTNFFTAKANLPRTITKTNAHKMRVTATITAE